MSESMDSVYLRLKMLPAEVTREELGHGQGMVKG